MHACKNSDYLMSGAGFWWGSPSVELGRGGWRRGAWEGQNPEFRSQKAEVFGFAQVES
jgi:hypothetical protein